jgi:DNA-binding MarR family transcriptional regulator
MAISTASRKGSGGTAALEALIGETVALFHRLRVVAAGLHGQGEPSAGRRGILRDLAREALSVPQLARARPVSRQHVQSLVNPLLRDGYLVAIANPAHRRSPLLVLTGKGRRLVERMQGREARLLGVVVRGLRERELRAAATTLARTREALAGRAARSARGRGHGPNRRGREA